MIFSFTVLENNAFFGNFTVIDFFGVFSFNKVQISLTLLVQQNAFLVRQNTI
jgi:hypothetical protein